MFSSTPGSCGRDALANADYDALVKESLRRMIPEAEGRQDRRQLNGLVSSGAGYRLRAMALTDPEVLGRTVPVWVAADDDVDMLLKGHADRNVPEGSRRLSDKQLAWIDRLVADGRLEKRFNLAFLTGGTPVSRSWRASGGRSWGRSTPC